MPTRRFAPLPYQALQDDRLRATEIRVLAYLCTHDPRRHGELIACTRDLIARETGLPETSVSRAITRLIRFGWLEKAGGGYRTKRNEYRIRWEGGKGNNPDTLSNHEKGNNPDTLSGAEKGSKHATQSPGKGVKRDTTTPYSKNIEPIDTPFYRIGSTCEETLHAETDRADVFSFTEAAKVLQAYGVPDSYLRTATDRRLVIAWTREFSRHELVAACQRANEMRKQQDDHRPIGPRYVDRILRNPRGNDHGAGKKSGSQSVADRAEQSNIRWLEQSGGI